MVDITHFTGKLKQSVEEANVILKQQKTFQDAKIEQNRNIVRMNSESKADEIIARIPHLIKYALLGAKSNLDMLGWLKVYNLNIVEDLTNHEYQNQYHIKRGIADPKPGSFGEYLFNRLNELGFICDCRYDIFFSFLPISCSYNCSAWIAINLKQLPV